MGLFSSKAKNYTVKIQSTGDEIQVDSKTTILQAALDQGLTYPHRCRVGSCTSCKTKLVDGKIKELTDTAYVLSMEDIQGGTILACQSIPKCDLTIDVALGDAPAEEFEGTITRVDSLTHDILGITLSLDRSIFYTAGQYADLAFEGLDRPRNYSFASRSLPQGNREVRFQIRKVPGGRFTEWLFEKDRTGAKLKVGGPFGEFQLKPADAPLLFIAGGSGMAPILSILESAGGEDLQRDAVYLFGARTQADLYAIEEIKNATRKWQGKFEFIPVLSHEPDESDWHGRRGLVTEMLPEIKKLGERHAYLCGPPGMIDAALDHLKGSGIQDGNIHFDRFTDSSHLLAAAQ
ncbi:MAG: 2Fe-2S iron-sulfur cluster binding domain-containing protein [Leptospiraceae bacterium]|nr:2Fe-2S iron-sulfur cluster binding domain-containing protein [Leptospiraceae bacterium]